MAAFNSSSFSTSSFSVAAFDFGGGAPEPTPEPTQPPLAGGIGKKLRLNTANYDRTRYEDLSPLGIYERREAIRRKAEAEKLAIEQERARVLQLAADAEQERLQEIERKRRAILLADDEAFILMMVH